MVLSSTNVYLYDPIIEFFFRIDFFFYILLFIFLTDQLFKFSTL